MGIRHAKKEAYPSQFDSEVSCVRLSGRLFALMRWRLQQQWLYQQPLYIHCLCRRVLT